MASASRARGPVHVPRVLQLTRTVLLQLVSDVMHGENDWELRKTFLHSGVLLARRKRSGHAECVGPVTTTVGAKHVIIAAKEKTFSWKITAVESRLARLRFVCVRHARHFSVANMPCCVRRVGVPMGSSVYFAIHNARKITLFSCDHVLRALDVYFASSVTHHQLVKPICPYVIVVVT